VAAARELRDRWLERVNAVPRLSAGKYDVSRAADGGGEPPRRLTVAAAVLALPAPVLAAPVAA
jgi:hypothetical protein